MEVKMEQTLLVKGMMCMHCRKHVEDALRAVPGVTVSKKLNKISAASNPCWIVSPVPVIDFAGLYAAVNANKNAVKSPVVIAPLTIKCPPRIIAIHSPIEIINSINGDCKPLVWALL